MTTSNELSCPMSTATAAAEKVLRASRNAISDIQVDPAFLKVVALIADGGGTVITTGVGTSGDLASGGANLLASHEIPARFIHATDAAHGLLGAITARDILIAVSESGCTPEVVDFAVKAQERASRVVVLTSTPRSALSHPDRIEIVLPVPLEAFPKASCAARSAWFSALTAATAAHRREHSDRDNRRSLPQ
ncbi:SIS domain-containing protein [Kibdelosporangium phytohabitans]|uniref:SIS domain-containing protein n=1 Tax=Kibdelosporangium phytohabitans TaxID=860235 RepID=A0A0N9HU09_9PSEU|nr:SIS domain-containing protein [Kibdelosporangium phytohabitans]ALG06422.1 hypothetical protein AOZ06_05310 [Kibdelosporangium phytohabitans]MBE1467579.1 arabinose-5-phosphate isomerase [Kibdelosporangium phytohabitans]